MSISITFQMKKKTLPKLPLISSYAERKFQRKLRTKQTTDETYLLHIQGRCLKYTLQYYVTLKILLRPV